MKIKIVEHNFSMIRFRNLLNSEIIKLVFTFKSYYIYSRYFFIFTLSADLLIIIVIKVM